VIAFVDSATTSNRLLSISSLALNEQEINKMINTDK